VLLFTTRPISVRFVRYCSATTAHEPPLLSPRQQVRAALQEALGEIEASYRSEAINALRDSAPQEDDDGNPLWPAPNPPAKGRRKRNPAAEGTGVRFPQQQTSPRPTRSEIEQRLAQIQLWLAQRQPTIYIRDQAALLWGMTSYCTLKKYLRVARSRMVEELVDDRLMHQAEQIYALMDVARRAADAEQFSAAVGAHRVICEITGMLRAPIKPPAAA
jgi:hypothetical protein